MRKQARIFTVLLGVILVLGLGLGLAGCKDEDDSNPFVGTYTATVEGHIISLVVTETTWEAWSDGHSEASGTYTYSGNTATLKQEGEPDQTATLSGKTLTTVYNGETFTLTKN